MTEFKSFSERLDELEAKLAALEGLTGEPDLGSSSSLGTSLSMSSSGSLGGSAPPSLPARTPPATSEGLAALAALAAAEDTGLDGVQELLGGELAQTMAKFQKRCTDVDPITNQTRYGENMKKKVTEAYKRFETLVARANALRPAVDVAAKDAAARRAAAEEQARREEDERARVLAKQKEAERRQQEEAIAEEERRRAEEEAQHGALGEAAARAREMRRKEEEDRLQAIEEEKARLRAEDEALLASVAPGLPGVEQALGELLEACGGERTKAYRDAVGALALYVANVLSHPEEAAYKRVREQNPLFRAKVGAFRGGVEALVAAGFVPQREDKTGTGTEGGGGSGEGEGGGQAQAQAGESSSSSSSSSSVVVPPLQPSQVAGLYQRVFVMHEPEVTDPSWTAWYDRCKAVRDRLQEEASRRA